MKAVPRTAQRLPYALLWMTLLLVSASAALGGTAEPELVIVGGTGLLGGTVGVTIQLSHDTASTAVSADLDIAFPTDLVEFNTPVSTNCRVAARLATTHQVGGRLTQPGLLSLALFARALELIPLGDGELMTCDFHILPNADAPTAPLTTQFVGLVDVRGDDVPVLGVDGAIVIADVTPLPGQCAVDCNGDGKATIDELVRGVGIALGNLPLTACPASDSNGDGKASISELINGVNRVLYGC